MLKSESENPEIQRIIKKYGQGFDIIYFNGKSDGFKDGKLEFAKNPLKNGSDI